MAKHRFGPGNKANPSGRPKVDVDFRKMCRRICDDKVLARWQREIDEDGPNWMKASELLAAYGHGKPTQAIDYTNKTDDKKDRDSRLEAAVRAAKKLEPARAGDTQEQHQGERPSNPAGHGRLPDARSSAEPTPPGEPEPSIN